MFFRRITSEGLSHHSYFIANGGGAIVIDPRRDIDVYLRLAQQRGLRIRYVIETHRNEDYVIGSTALGEASGAEILHSGRTDFEYGAPVSDGDTIEAGRLRVRVLETPGHTYDSLTLAVSDLEASPDPFAAFTGDSLFIGDTGRTDLLGADHEQQLSEHLYHSLFNKILPLGDRVVLLPAHGGGSVCGGSISDRDLSTLGFERLNNPSLRWDREAFVRRKMEESHLKPPYFRRMEEWNLRGTAPIWGRLPVPPPLSAGELSEHVDDGAVVVDARMPQAFAGGHIPGSYNIWLEGLSAYMGWVVAPGQRIVMVLPEAADVFDVTRQLLRIGYDEIDGYLRGGFEAWQNDGREVDRHDTIDTHALRQRLGRGEELLVLDVRKPSEWAEGSIEGARRIFVGDLENRIDELPREKPIVSMCSVGHRGGIAASILARHGFSKVYNYLGGFTAWRTR